MHLSCYSNFDQIFIGIPCKDVKWVSLCVENRFMAVIKLDA